MRLAKKYKLLVTKEERDAIRNFYLNMLDIPYRFTNKDFLQIIMHISGVWSLPESIRDVIELEYLGDKEKCIENTMYGEMRNK